MKFKRFEDESRWIAEEQDYVDWKGFPVIELVDLYEHMDEDEVDAENRYTASLNIVSLTYLSVDDVKEIKESSGRDESFKWTKEELARETFFTGRYVVLKSYSGSNAYMLLRRLLKDLVITYRLIGFFLDQPANRIGHTGWDILKGDLSLETAMKNIERYAS